MRTCICLLMLVAGCSQTLGETANAAPNGISHRTLIGKAISNESITVVAKNGSLHPADVIKFATGNGSTEEFVSTFACPLNDDHHYAVTLEASDYHYMGKRVAGVMPSYLVRFCGRIDDDKSYGSL